MNCGRSREWIALWVEGDLPGDKAQRLEAHLAGCGGCREYAARLRASQAVLKGLLAEQAEETPASVRARVLERIAAEGGQRRAVWPRWAFAAAAVLVMLGGWLALRVEAPLPAGPPAPRTMPPPKTVPATAPKPAPKALGRARLARRPPRPRKEPGPLLVKLETSDPNVVIYWIVEGKGD